MKNILLVCSVANLICGVACMLIIFDYFYKVRKLKMNLEVFEDMLTRIASNLTQANKSVETLSGICGTHEEILTNHMDALENIKSLMELNREHFDELDEFVESESSAHIGLDEVLKSTQDEIVMLCGKVDELKKAFDGTVKELTDAQIARDRAEAKSEELWSEGLSSLMDYGVNVARLNTEGIHGTK